jgi:hypothetical protein
MPARGGFPRRLEIVEHLRDARGRQACPVDRLRRPPPQLADQRQVRALLRTCWKSGGSPLCSQPASLSGLDRLLALGRGALGRAQPRV